ncbi:hypothetical protein NCAS_0A07910 [Naumovozyma castellii]|uniref:Large ribosomal subunit protein mL40 n=1 Tax=Naumovozyma castellii TaxID=27288 RepID=G0V7A1_NAUCA|nr:hypothetical protein NCAS_0A07910 [Naumovozyma castellii CBS 4309]CCC67349.1 hypothetical protein NCAS_0A07910 [Naumovozyma castellii CBS 4309]
MLSNSTIMNVFRPAIKGPASVSASSFLLTSVRTKRTTAKSSGTTGVSPQVQRVTTQLSVLSARKKQPKMLKLCPEDLIKHQTIENCWIQYQRDVRNRRSKTLEKQFKSIKTAMNTLQEVNPVLFKLASEATTTATEERRFPLEYRIPTDFPPNKDKVWCHNYTSPTTKNN